MANSSFNQTFVDLPISLANGGTGKALIDPGADRLMFWDDSAGETAYLTAGSGLSIAGTTITASGTGASTSLDNLASIAINTSLISDADNTDDLGSSLKEWKDLYVDGTAYIDAIDLNGTAITADAGELNILDGATLNVTELNYVDGVTSAIQTQIDGKQPLDSDLTTISGLTATTDNFLVSVASAWASRTPSQAKTTLAIAQADVTGLTTASNPTFAGLNLGTGDISTMGDIAMDGDAVRDITIGRKSSAAAGATLTIQSGGAHSGDTNTAGGNLILASGIATGNSRSAIQFNVPTSGASGVTDASPAWAASVWQASANGPVISLVANSSTTGIPISSNVFAVRGTVAGGIVAYRHTTSETAGNTFTVQAGGATSTATNKAGGALILSAGISTGSGSGQVRIQAPVSTAASTTDNALVNRMILNNSVALTSGAAATIATCTIAAGQMVGGVIKYSIFETDGTDMITESGEVAFSLVLKSTTYTSATSILGTVATAKSDVTDTIVTTFAFNATTGLQVTSTITGNTPSTFKITYTVVSHSDQAVTAP